MAFEVMVEILKAVKLAKTFLFTDTKGPSRGILYLGRSLSKRTQLITLIQKSYIVKWKIFQRHVMSHCETWSCTFTETKPHWKALGGALLSHCQELLLPRYS